MLRLLIGALVAAVVMFGWGFYFWSELAVQAGLYQSLPGETQDKTDAVVDALNAAPIESGVYFFPVLQPEEDEKNFEKRYNEGPLLIIHYHAGGAEVLDWTMFTAGFVHMLAVCLILGSILKFAVKPDWAYLTRVGFILAIGVVASLFIDGNWVVWRHSNVKFHHYSAMYHVGAVLVAGLVLAGFVKAKPAA